MNKRLQRIATPIIFWFNLFRVKVGRLFRRPTKIIEVPSELLPLLQVGTLAKKYAEFMELEPEDLKISVKLQEVVDGEADRDSMLFVEKVLFGKHLFDTVFDWLVFVGDARESDRELFRVYLTLPSQNKQK